MGYEPTHPSLYEKDKLAFDASVVKGLNDRQTAYVIGLGRFATEEESWTAAGYKQRPPMTERLREAISAIWGQRIMDPAEILGRKSEIARANYNDFIEPATHRGYILRVPTGKGHLVKSVTVDKDGVITRLELENRMGALVELAKLQNLYPKEARPSPEPPQIPNMEINFIDASTKIDYRTHIGPPPDGPMVDPYPPIQEKEDKGGTAVGKNGVG